MRFDAKLVHDLFDYRPTGDLIWRVNTGKKRLVGSVAGTRRADGRWRVGIWGNDYYVHHLVWAWHHGAWPTGRLDHKSVDPGDNRIDNLREANQSQNMANGRARSWHLKGAYPVEGAETWRSFIMVDGKTIGLGNFPTEREAHEAYNAAAVRYFGEFARAA